MGKLLCWTLFHVKTSYLFQRLNHLVFYCGKGLKIKTFSLPVQLGLRAVVKTERN